jgi:hypothetical protein
MIPFAIGRSASLPNPQEQSQNSNPLISCSAFLEELVITMLPTYIRTNIIV